MNLAIFTEMEKVDGQGRYLMLHARWLCKHGHNVVLFSPESPMLEQIEGTGIVHVPINSVRQGIALDYDDVVIESGRLVRECAARGVEAMIATARLPFMMATNAFGDSLPIYLPILSDTYFLPETPRAAQYVARAAREGRVFAPARSIARGLGAKFGFDAVDVRCYRFPIDDRMRRSERHRDEVRASLGVADDELLVLTITRLDIDKAPGIPPFANAVETLNRHGARVKLFVVGDGSLAQQTKAQCPASTTFLGTRYDLADLYHACDLYAGEGTTIYEAAMASRPVIITGTSWHPESPENVFGIYGVHVIDHVFLEPTNYAPLTPYLDALLPLVSDEHVRERLGEAAFDTVTSRNGVDQVMPWIVDLLSGKPVDSIIFEETADLLVTLAGGMADGIDTIGELCAQHGDALRIGVSFEEAVPYARVVAMPIENAQALARASRRATADSTRPIRFDGKRFHDTEALPEDVLRVLKERETELPPTSFEPCFAFSPPRSPIYVVFAASASSAAALLSNVTLSDQPEGAVVAWVPGSTAHEGSALIEEFEERSGRTIALVSGEIPWTTIGRLLITAERYIDDGDSRFEDHRRLVRRLGIPV